MLIFASVVAGVRGMPMARVGPVSRVSANPGAGALRAGWSGQGGEGPQASEDLGEEAVAGRRVSCPAWGTSRPGTLMSRRRRGSIMALPPRPPRPPLPFHFVAYLIHGWDVARAIGAAGAPDDGLAQVALSFAARWPDTPATRGPGAPFGPRIAVPDDAPPFDRLLGLLGRPPSWPAPPGPVPG